jgi:hypothetical protein
MARQWCSTGVVGLLLLLGGCATATLLPALPPQVGLADIHRLIRAHAAQDARYQLVIDHPYLQIDLKRRYQIPDYQNQTDLAAKQKFVQQFLRDSASLAQRSVALALAKIPATVLATFAREQGLSSATPDSVLAAVQTEQRARFATESARIAGLQSGLALDQYWQGLVAHLEPSIMTRGRLARRLLTAPAVPFIAGWIGYHNQHDYRGPVAPDFKSSVEFAPALGVAPPTLSAEEWALLQRYAPHIVQETSTRVTYPAAFDQFGAVSLVAEAEHGLVPQVNSAAPTVYAFIDQKILQGQPVRQLVYTLWYPQHPKMKGFDPEAGPLDGWTIRLSLNDRNVPVVLESVSNCGCYYKIFPSDHLEAQAAAAFPSKLPGKTFHLEQHQTDRFDAVVPETVAGLSAQPQNLLLYFSAGHHQLVTVRTRPEATPTTTATYALRLYDELEHLRGPAQEVGLFGEDGLVRAAERAECTMLSPSGVYHAGHPRQRETQMIYFDEADLDDPRLLERYLRLPPAAFMSAR